MKTPQELKLPKKFKSWRPGQGELIEKIAHSEAKVFLLDAPTGTGKSLIGIGVHQSRISPKVSAAVLARLSGKPLSSYDYHCVYVTRTKQLQDQILLEFPATRSIKGRNNYICMKHQNEFPDFTAEDCNNTTDHCGDCPYMMAKREALHAPVAVLNTSYFLAEANGPGQFRNADLLVIDEIDQLENELLSHIQLKITTRQLGRLGLELPKDAHSLQGWLVWASQVTVPLNEGIFTLGSQLDLIPESEWSDVEITMHKQAGRLKSFRDKILMFVSNVNDSWLFSEEEKEGETSWTFKPVRVDAYAERYLWQHAKRFLGMSGTILDPEILAADLGIEDWEYEKTASPFPLQNRPIHYLPVANLTYKNQVLELPKMAQVVADIIDKYPEDKVLVHTTSFFVQSYLMKNLNTRRLMSHDSFNRASELEKFKTSRHPVVMLSPSFDRGVDLPNDLCRCVIICKVPYISLGDPQVEARMKMPGGERWYLLKAAQTIMQMSGRGVRSINDYCDTYILDKQFGSLLNRMRQYFPQWWLDAIVCKDLREMFSRIRTKGIKETA